MSKHLINAVNSVTAPPCDQLKCRHRSECANGKACTLFRQYLNMSAGMNTDYTKRGDLSGYMIPSEKIYKEIFSN